MRKFFILLCIAIFGLKVDLLSASTPEEQPYVIILSMDGFRYDLADRCHTPTLDSLKRVGCYSEIFPVFPANTFPNHYSIATGLHPDHHKVVNNSFYDRKEGRYLSVFDFEDTRLKDFWGGDPIWNTAERQGREAHIFMWPGSEVKIGGRQATRWMRYSSKPSYWERASWVIETMTQPVEKIPNLVMWYFENPDSQEHRYGPDAPQVNAVVEHIDSVLTYFFREIRRSPVYKKINFIITADHGMSELSEDRRVNLYPLLDSSKVIRVVKGSPYGLEVEPSYREEALRIIRQTGHMKAWLREEIPACYHYGTCTNRIANLVLLPDLGWQIDYSPNPRPLRKKGAHGFDNYLRDMHMVFYGSGPAFKKGHTQPTFQDLNIYLIMCHLLGITPSPNDGRWQDVEDMFLE